MRLGIDIGGTKTAAVVVDGSGATVAVRQALSGRGAGVVEVALQTANAAVLAAGGPSVVESVGACIPGVVDVERGIVRHAVNLDVEHLELAELLADRLGHPVAVENDVKAAAIGAFLATGADASGTFGYLNLGTGLAAAILRDGRIDRGPNGVLGEIGHVPVGGALRCTCGQTGCLETVASGGALQQRFGVWGPGLPTVFDLAAAGDGDAALAALDLVHGVRVALHLLVVAAGASRVVVGGGLTGLGEPLTESLRVELRHAEAQSPLLASLNLWERTTILDSPVPLAALGAAALPTFGPRVAAGA